VVRAETSADILEHEEGDPSSATRRRDEDEQVSPLSLEPSVLPRARARVADRPPIAVAASREPDRGVLPAPWSRGALDEKQERLLVGMRKQGASAGRVPVEDGVGKALDDTALDGVRGRHRRSSAARGDYAGNQQAADRAPPAPEAPIVGVPSDSPWPLSTAYPLHERKAYGTGRAARSDAVGTNGARPRSPHVQSFVPVAVSLIEALWAVAPLASRRSGA
jgi:hypothetical protein